MPSVLPLLDREADAVDGADVAFAREEVRPEVVDLEQRQSGLPCVRGSSASRRPSATKFAQRISDAIADARDDDDRSGATGRRRGRPAPSSPTTRRGGLIPRPMNERNASPRITPGSSRKTETIRMPSVFGSRWRNEDAVPARADRLGGADVVVLLQGDHLTAHDAGGREPAGDRERDHHRPEVHGADDRQRDDREGQVRQAVERVEEAHHPVVELPADEAGDRAVDDADREDRDRGARSRSRSRRGRRAPCATNRSRPNWSVPNGCAHARRQVRPARSRRRSGRTARRSGREMQYRTMSHEARPLRRARRCSRDVAAPGVAPEARLPDRRRRRAPRGPLDASSRRSSRSRCGLTADQAARLPRARVEEAVEDVDDEVRDDDERASRTVSPIITE